MLEEGGGDAAHVGRQLLPQAEGVVVDEGDGRHVGQVVHQEDVVWECLGLVGSIRYGATSV